MEEKRQEKIIYILFMLPSSRGFYRVILSVTSSIRSNPSSSTYTLLLIRPTQLISLLIRPVPPILPFYPSYSTLSIHHIFLQLLSLPIRPIQPSLLFYPFFLTFSLSFPSYTPPSPFISALFHQLFLST